MGRLNIATALLILVSSKAWSQDLDGAKGSRVVPMEQVSEVIELLSSMNHASIGTQGSVRRSGDVCTSSIQASRCEFIEKLIIEDKNDAFFGRVKGYYKTCSQHVSSEDSDEFQTALDLSRYLGKAIFPDLGEDHAAFMERCEFGTVERSKEAVTKFIYYSERVRRSQARIIEEIAAIDQVIGASGLEEIRCHSPFESVIKRCAALRDACQGSGADMSSNRALSLLVDATQKAFVSIAKLKSDLQYARNKLATVARSSAQGQRYLEEMKSMYDEMASIEASLPWIKGKEFRKHFRVPGEFRKAIFEQLSSDRRKLIEIYNAAGHHYECLNGSSGVQKTKKGECRTDETLQFIDENTELGLDRLSAGPGANGPHVIASYSYLRFQECAHKNSINTRQLDSALRTAATDLGLVGLTLGAGALVSASKGALTAGARIGAMSQRTTMARYANGAVTVADGAYATQSLMKAVEQCQRVELKENESHHFGKIQKNSCETDSVIGARIAEFELEKCAAQVAMALVDSVPLGVAGAQFLFGGLPRQARAVKGGRMSTRTGALNVIENKGDIQLAIWEARRQGRLDEAATLKNEVVETLQNGRIIPEKSRDIGIGASNPKAVMFEGGIEAIWKPFHGRGASGDSEIAVYNLDEYLGTNRVPVVVERKLFGKRGTVHLRVNQLKGRTPKHRDFPEHLQIFDYLIQNWDRRYVNYLLASDGTTVAIDAGVALSRARARDGYQVMFSTVQSVRSDLRRAEVFMNKAQVALSQPVTDSEKKKIMLRLERARKLRSEARQRAGILLLPDDVMVRLSRLDYETTKALFGPGIPDTEVRAFLERRDEIISVVDSLKSEFGDDIVPGGPVSPLIPTQEYIDAHPRWHDSDEIFNPHE